MGRYDFDKVIERRGTNSTKWDCDVRTRVEGIDYPVGELLPLWVADMDFEAAPEIREALADRIRHGILGYTLMPDSCYEAIIGWEEKRHGWKMEKEWLTFAPGSVPALHMAVQAYCQPGDRVIIQRPVYYPFFRTILNNGTHIANNPLIERNGAYEIDFEDFEQQARDPRTTCFILCSPHNPVARVWKPEELERMGKICADNGVVVLADELHCDMIMPGYRHTPFASLNAACRDNSITIIAPTKTFNLAGLHATVIAIPNEKLRLKFKNILARNSIVNLNIFAVIAMEAAYRHGGGWLDEVLAYIHGNYEFLVGYLKEKLPLAKPYPLEGSYMAWIDFRALEKDPMALQKRMLTEAGLWLDEGHIFGPEGNGFERIVLACPRSILKECLDRIIAMFSR